MRIIAGRWRSRTLAQPPGRTTRPMPDRVREAVFNVLGAHYECPGALPALHVADVFAGTGSIGLEALSRGAASCCFFERDRPALAALRQNLASVEAGPEATVVTQDAWHSVLVAPSERPFDLVFLDPPYEDTKDVSESGPFHRFLVGLFEHGGPGPLVVLHHHAKVGLEITRYSAYRIVDQRTLGTNGVTIFSR